MNYLWITQNEKSFLKEWLSINWKKQLISTEFSDQKTILLFNLQRASCRFTHEMASKKNRRPMETDFDALNALSWSLMRIESYHRDTTKRTGCIKSTNYSLPRCTQPGRILYVLFYWVTLRSFCPLQFYVSYDFEWVRAFYQNYTCFPFKWNSSQTEHLAKHPSIETEKIWWNARVGYSNDRATFSHRFLIFALFLNIFIWDDCR